MIVDDRLRGTLVGVGDVGGGVVEVVVVDGVIGVRMGMVMGERGGVGGVMGGKEDWVGVKGEGERGVVTSQEEGEE